MNNNRKNPRPSYEEFSKRCEELGTKNALRSVGISNTVSKSPELSKGVGDTVAKMIKKATGGKVVPCSACEKRKQMLNKMFPYKK
jgi:hypothetical protein